MEDPPFLIYNVTNTIRMLMSNYRNNCRENMTNLNTQDSRIMLKTFSLFCDHCMSSILDMKCNMSEIGIATSDKHNGVFPCALISLRIQRRRVNGLSCLTMMFFTLVEGSSAEAMLPLIMGFASE